MQSDTETLDGKHRFHRIKQKHIFVKTYSVAKTLLSVFCRHYGSLVKIEHLYQGSRDNSLAMACHLLFQTQLYCVQ